MNLTLFNNVKNFKSFGLIFENVCRFWILKYPNFQIPAIEAPKMNRSEYKINVILLKTGFPQIVCF